MPAEAANGNSVLDGLRNMEELAALGQFLFCFGTDVLSLPDFDREELETELLTPESALLDNIKMALLKMVSSHRGLIPSQFEEYTRRQYLNRKPDANPFGDGAEPMKFSTLDVFARVKVLHQLSVWVFLHPDRVRDKMKDSDEKEQLTWRMEPCGYDRKGNTYYILDDNRLYRRSPWILESQPVKKAKSKKKGTKRRRVSIAMEEDTDETDDPTSNDKGTLEGSKDPDESALYTYLKEDVIPELTKAWMEKEKQRQLHEAVANRKRSSRLDAKLTRQKEEEEKEAARIREAELEKNTRREKLEAERKEKEREARVKIREQRIKERELHNLQKDNSSRGTSTDDSSTPGTRRSSRRAKEKTSKDTTEDEKEWIFDCVCGANGINYEDGTEIIACDSCDVWQHLSCQKLAPGAENDDFICDLCRRYKQSENGPKGPDGLPMSPQIIKLRMGPLSPEKPRGRSPPKVPNDQATVVGDMIQVLPPETANREVLP